MDENSENIRIQWKPKQIQAIEKLALGAYNTDAASERGVNEKTIRDWKKKPEFLDAIDKEARLFARGLLPKAFNTLERAMQSMISVEAAKTVLKMSGDLKDKLEFEDKTITVGAMPKPTPEQQALCDKATKLNGEG